MNKDIDFRLNRIVSRHAIDLYCEKYRKRYDAERFLVSYFSSRKKRIACIATRPNQVFDIKHFVRDHKSVDFFLCKKSDSFSTKVYDAAYDTSALHDVSWQNYDEVLIVSYEGVSFLRHYLRQHHICHAWLYDCFALAGISLSGEWQELLSDPAQYWWTEHLMDVPRWSYNSMELFEELRESEQSQDEGMELLHLRRAFYLAIVMRDFLCAEKCVKRLKGRVPSIDAAWQEIEDLLSEIRFAIREKEKRDVILIWTDAIPYEDVGIVPYLKEEKEKGICFDNCFTVTPFTNPTCKTMLLGKMPIEDDTYAVKRIDEGNSPLLRMLNEQGYDVCVITSSMHLAYFPNTMRSDRFHATLEPSSAKLWDLWRNLLLRERPTFYIVHNLLETHEPYLSVNQTDKGIAYDNLRLQVAGKWLDAQYRFFLDPIPRRLPRVLLTDHGKVDYATRFHTYLVLQDERVHRHRHVQSLFSYLDFHKLMEEFLRNGEVSEEHFARDYVEVEDLDTYDEIFALAIFHHKTPIPPTFFGYYGVISPSHIYLKFSNGREWFVERGKDAPQPNFFQSYICDESVIGEYRKLVDTRPPIPDTVQQKLRYAERVHVLYRRALARNLKKKEILDALLCACHEKTIIIRMGGRDARGIMEMISEEAKARIAGFVDIDEACACAVYGLPIYSRYEAIPNTVRCILLSSGVHRADLLQESLEWRKKWRFIDPYRYLEDQGICVRHGIGDFELCDEDYDQTMQMNPDSAHNMVSGMMTW